MENVAVYGGAIYQSEDNSAYGSQSACVFSFETCSGSDALVNFTSNDAHVSGNSVFFNDPTSACSDEVKNQHVVVHPDCTHQFTSSAVNITFIVNGTMEIILGQQITLQAVVLDFFNQTAFAFVSVILSPDASSNVYQPNSYYVSGFTSFSLQNGSNSLSLTIAGPEIAKGETVSTYSLMFTTVQQNPQVETSVHFILKPCPLGFVYNDTVEMCTCAHANKDNFNCNLQLGTACVTRGFWFGNVSGTNVISLCISGYCSDLNGNCTHCADQILDGTCRLQQNEATECAMNRAGILCTECSQNYSFTFGAINCVHNTKCTGENEVLGVLIFILMIVSDIFLIVSLFILLRFDYSLHSGTMFCFIYYFSVINTVLPSYNVPTSLRIIVSVIKSFTQLDPHYLGHIPICFFTQFNSPLQQIALLYVNPIMISISVPIIIFLFGRCSKLTCGENTGVRAITLLFLLSFTALTETSFLILQPLKFSEISQSVYVGAQPSTTYLNPTMHVWLVVIAVLLISLVIIPFTLFLLLAPCLVRYINPIKFMPFLDEFQGSYKDQFRWMAGFYFLCRLIYLTVVLIGISHFLVVEYCLQFVSIGVVTFHTILQPYKSYWLNLSDTLLLVDIAVVSMLHGVTSDVIFEFGRGFDGVRVIATYVLVLFPVLYVLIIIVLTVVQYPCLKVKVESCRKKIRSKLRVVTTSTVTTSTVNISQSLADSGDSEPLSTGDRGFREPLLGLLGSEDVREYVVYSYSSTHNLPKPSQQASTASSRCSNHAAVMVASCTSQSWQDEAGSDNGSDL